jgi:carbon monoxide dehydrogenase subunit G
MRFTGQQQLRAASTVVWAALHDADVLRSVIPGCERLVPLGRGEYAATLAARVGPLADCYRGRFTIEPVSPGRELRVVVEGRGRFGRLELVLDVGLAPGQEWDSTALTYDARATVGGVVARVGGATMGVVGSHLTACFFRDLDRALARRAPAGRPLATAG